jgi:hypothetical protein
MVPEDTPRTHVVRGNVAVDVAAGHSGDRDESNVVVMMGRPAPVPH